MKKTRILVLLLTLLLTLSCLTLPLLAAAEPAAEDPSATASADASADASGDAQDTAEQESSQEVIVSADPSFTVAAKAALLIDLNTGRTVYEQDADERVYPASLTKIMTCLLALENGNLSDVITVDESALSGLDQDSSVVGLQVGEQITLEDLLYCMMVHSGNDAANAVVAEYIAGSVADFVRMMNERAYELGCKDTHFNNPHGLHDESHYTTARDLARITQAALKSENFRQIVDTAEYVIPESATGEEHKLKTTNLLIYKSTGNSLYYPRATGVKTGYTSAAGRCLIATAEDDGIRFLSVLCGAKTTILDTGDLLMESFPETIKLLDYGFDNFSYVTALSPLYPIDQVTVLNSAGSEAVAVAPAKDVRLLLPANYNPEALRTEVLLDANEVEAPVSEGQKLGLARVYYGNELIDETDLLAIADVTRSELSSVATNSTAYIQQNWWKWIVFLILGIIAAFLILLVLLQIRRRRLRRMRLEKRRRDWKSSIAAATATTARNSRRKEGHHGLGRAAGNVPAMYDVSPVPDAAQRCIRRGAHGRGDSLRRRRPG